MLKSIIGVLALMLVFSVPAFGENLKANKEKSKIEFLGKKKDGKHGGGFKDFKADVQIDHESPNKSTLSIEIVTDSIWSDDEKLTGHLRNPDFFDVKKHPTIKFETTKLEVDGDSGTLTGKLTMLGKAVEVKIPIKAEISDASLKVMADFKIDRTKWGMNYGKGNIEDEVSIKAELLFPRN